MEVRDKTLLETAMRSSFPGYALRHRARGTALERIITCVALLSTMLMSGIVLGTTSKRQLRR